MPKALIAFFALLLFAAAVQADQQVQVIQLEHRAASEVVPLIKPLLDSDVSLVADGFRLLVRGTPDQTEQTRKLVAQLDKAPQTLRLTLRTTRGDSSQAAGGSIQGHATTDGAQGRVHIYSTENDDEGTTVQHVRVTEGHPAYVHNDLQIPIVARAGFVGRRGAGYSERREHKTIPDGFYVLATVHGDTVTVRLAAHKATLTGKERGSVNTAGITTTVTGPLGRWLSVGGVSREISRHGDGTVYSTQQRRNTDLSWELKADKADH